MAQINMTPMIDVLLVLLIIFMAISPRQSQGLPANIPQTAQSNVTAPQEDDVVLTVSKTGGLSLNTHPVEAVDLAGKLTSIYANRASRALFVRGQGDLTFGNVAEVLDIARDAGVDKIALLTGQNR